MRTFAPTQATEAKTDTAVRHPDFVVSHPADAAEREADRIAEAATGAPGPAASHPVAISAPFPRTEIGTGPVPAPGPGFANALAAAGSGRPLPAAERAFFEPRFGRDLSGVRIHDDAHAAALSGAIDARAFTRGRDVFLGDGERGSCAAGDRQLMAHEIAHTLQQGADLGSRVILRQPTNLGDIPASTRRDIQISTTPITVPPERITAFFSLLPSGNPGERQMITGTSTVFDAGIAENLQTGLGSIGAWLATSTNALPMNRTIEVELDLSAHGGAARRYRFTRFVHRTGTGHNATNQAVLLIEDVGAAVTTPAQATVPTSVTVGTGTYSISGAWSQGDYAVLHEALTLLPAAAQTSANGLTFSRNSGNAPGVEAGHYDPDTDTVELYDNSFPTASIRFGGRSFGVRIVLHEIGHAIDLRTLEQAWQRFGAAGQSDAARMALLAARSASGTRWVRDEDSGDYNQEIVGSDRVPAFRNAAQRDGLAAAAAGATTEEGAEASLRGGITSYSDADYQELYAESFMLFVSDPEALRLLRPATYAYFLQNFPAATP